MEKNNRKGVIGLYNKDTIQANMEAIIANPKLKEFWLTKADSEIELEISNLGYQIEACGRLQTKKRQQLIEEQKEMVGLRYMLENMTREWNTYFGEKSTTLRLNHDEELKEIRSDKDKLQEVYAYYKMYLEPRVNAITQKYQGHKPEVLLKFAGVQPQVNEDELWKGIEAVCKTMGNENCEGFVKFETPERAIEPAMQRDGAQNSETNSSDQSITGRIKTAKDKVVVAGGSVVNKVASAGKTVANKGKFVAGKVKDVAESIPDKIAEKSEELKDLAEEKSEKLEDWAKKKFVFSEYESYINEWKLKTLDEINKEKGRLKKEKGLKNAIGRREKIKSLESLLNEKSIKLEQACDAARRAINQAKETSIPKLVANMKEGINYINTQGDGIAQGEKSNWDTMIENVVEAKESYLQNYSQIDPRGVIIEEYRLDQEPELIELNEKHDKVLGMYERIIKEIEEKRAEFFSGKENAGQIKEEDKSERQ